MMNSTSISASLYCFGLLCICLLMSCDNKDKINAEPDRDSKTMINTSHLDAMYEEKIVDGDTVGIIHIYSEYPDYKWKGDDDEGIACVDDATRAAIFYLRQFKATSNLDYLRKGQMLIKFLLTMQAPNGYYYNFIWPDGSIHKDGITSKPVPNFWAWRVLWAFGEALDVLEISDPLRNEIIHQRQILVRNILNEKSFQTNETDTTMGISFATWLPKTSGTDQAAIVLLGLSQMLRQDTFADFRYKDSIITLMDHFAEGIMLMQIEQPDSLHDGAFLSWENLWHAYANIQSYALLVTGEIFDDPHMISHAMYEIDRFYPAFLRAGGLDHFFVRADSSVISRYDTKSFSQIAYGRRPMIWASLKAYEMKKEEKYANLAKDLYSWFTGNNPANTPMYDPETGRGFDGISSLDAINKNAGAESTIESLLALQEMERYEMLKN